MKNALICTATATEGERLKFMLHELGFAQILESTDNDRACSLAADHLPDVAIIDTAARHRVGYSQSSVSAQNSIFLSSWWALLSVPSRLKWR